MNTENTSYTTSPDRTATARYAQLELEQETVVIYDRERTQAWIQSDLMIPTDAATAETSLSEQDGQYERNLAAMHAISPFDGDENDG